LVATAYLIIDRVGVAIVTVTGGRIVVPDRTFIGGGVMVAETMLVEVMVAVTAGRVEVLVTVG
jgi:hypothetical protein